MTCTSVCESRPLLCFCSQHISWSTKLVFFLALLSGCDHVTPTQKNETFSTSQGGGSVIFFIQQQHSERASRSRNRTAVCEYLRSIECQLCE